MSTSTSLPTPFAESALPQNATEAASALLNATQHAPRPMQGTQFISLGQERAVHEGRLAYGADLQAIPPESRWVLNVTEAQHGWGLRSGKNVTDARMVSVFQQPGGEPALPRDADPRVQEWKFFYSLPFACVASPDTAQIGDVAVYHNDNRGLVEMVQQQLMPQIAAKMREADQVLFPVVGFTVTSYASKKWGKTFYNPVAVIHEWFTADQVFGTPAEDPATAAPSPTSPSGQRVRSGTR